MVGVEGALEPSNLTN